MIHKNRKLIINAIKSTSIIPILSLLLSNGRNRISLEICRNIYYAAMVDRVSKKLNKLKFKLHDQDYDKYPNKVWVYWDSGMENAPDLVKKCASKLSRLDDVDVIFLNNSNINKYTNFPPHISNKMERGIIPKAHFSDLLRLELLSRHGGIWLDSTVLITGNKLPKELSSGELFVYAMDKPAKMGNPIFISSWAISSDINNPIIALVRDYLYAYWEKSNHLSDYFLFHVVMCAAMNSYPELVPRRIGFFNNTSPHLMQMYLYKDFDQDVFDEILEISNIHKLTHKLNDCVGGSFLEFILKMP